MNIVKSVERYDAWLRKQLKDEFVKKDLKKKHKKMAADPFQFLRATYWRWAETILDICPGRRRGAECARGRRYPCREFRNLARCGRSPGLGRERFR